MNDILMRWVEWSDMKRTRNLSDSSKDRDDNEHSLVLLEWSMLNIAAAMNMFFTQNHI